jgi:hypothetical protein
MRRIVLLVALLAAVPSTAMAQVPAPPGPPPGNGGDLPAPPGTAPGVVPPGTPAAIPSGATGPGLLSGAPVRFAKRRFSLPLACQASGRVSVQARGVRGGTFASRRYRCVANRTTVRFKVTRKAAKRIARTGTAAATATVRQGSGTHRISFELRARKGSAPAKGFWTDGNLACASGGPGTPAYLVEPNFTAPGATTVSTRGWVAWHTTAGGWHWLGVDGENAGRWDTWTATPSGIAQFFPPGATQPQRYSWGPISVPAGEAIAAVGVWEIVYWVSGQPNYSWQYVNAGTTGAVAAGGGTLACAYP